MKIASNKLVDVKRFFLEELKDIYPKEEIEGLYEYCVEEYLNCRLHELLAKKQEYVSESILLKFNFAVKDLKKNKPIQHIFGRADFYGLKLKVNENVLIPRQETEELVQLIIRENTLESPSVLDIGTGSGCIPIALKIHIPGARVAALDISENALEIASENAKQHAASISFFRQDILGDTSRFPGEKFDILVSNPPYVRVLEKEQMHQNVLDHEPHLALFVEDANPLVFYAAIADFALERLETGGKLYFEINEFLGEESKQLLVDKGFKNCCLLKDINGKNRILRAIR